MIRIRKSNERGRGQHGWLDSYHTFSFAGYYDPAHRGFRSLRVINQDRIAPGTGFDTHGHDNMEIISVVLEGALEHKDSMGHREVLRPGEVQLMSAGSGVRHSEYNPSSTEPGHFLQIWIIPGERNVKPAYGQKRFDAPEHGLVETVSGDGREGSLKANQDFRLYKGRLSAGREATALPLAAGRFGWVQVTSGDVTINGTRLNVGDGAAIEGEVDPKAESANGAEFLFFDLN